MITKSGVSCNVAKRAKVKRAMPAGDGYIGEQNKVCERSQLHARPKIVHPRPVLRFVLHTLDKPLYQKLQAQSRASCTGTHGWLQHVSWCSASVDQIWVEDVELVALHNFRRWIIRVVVHLIVLIPFVALLYTVVITGLPCYI